VSRTIWKYDVEPYLTNIPPPRDPHPLTVAMQGGKPVIYIEHAGSDKDGTALQFIAAPTGGFVPAKTEYLGTVLGVEGWMVFHIYRCFP
jgi:hypothetical protein